MARWTKSVRDAISVIENVEECLVEMGYHFNVDMYPYQTNGGRGNGISAIFNYNSKETIAQKYYCISIWNHHISDDICLQISKHRPITVIMGELIDDHDVSDLTFNYTNTALVAVTIILTLLKTIDVTDETEIYVDGGFGGMDIYTNKDNLLTARKNANRLINKLSSGDNNE